MEQTYATVLGAMDNILAQLRRENYGFKAAIWMFNMDECIGQFGQAGRIEITLGSITLTGFDPVTQRLVREDLMKWVIPAMVMLAEEAHDPHEPVCPHYWTIIRARELKEKLQKEWGMQ